jgi:hypothetical protein
MVFSVFFLLAVFACKVVIIDSSSGDPYGLITAVQTECEYQALTMGSRLGDAFNSYDEGVPFYRRFNHEFEQKSLIYHRIMMTEMERRHLPGFTKENNVKVFTMLALAFAFFFSLIFLERGSYS